jgi:hypothetical protein
VTRWPASTSTRPGPTTAVPRVVFTDPQVAAVGLTERAAREAGHDVLAVSYDIGHTAGGALYGKGTSGTAQLVIDRAPARSSGRPSSARGRGAPPRRDDRDRQRGHHRAAVARGPAFPTVSEVWLRLLEEVRAQEL